MPVVNAMSSKKRTFKRTVRADLFTIGEREEAKAERRKAEAAAAKAEWERQQQEQAAKRQARKDAAEAAARQAAQKPAKKVITLSVDLQIKRRVRKLTAEQREFAARMLARRMRTTTGLNVKLTPDEQRSMWQGVIDEAAAMLTEEDYAAAQEWFRQRQDPDRYTSSHGYEVYVAPKEDKS